jgi:hypothetical protein
MVLLISLLKKGCDNLKLSRVYKRHYETKGIVSFFYTRIKKVLLFTAFAVSLTLIYYGTITLGRILIFIILLVFLLLYFSVLRWVGNNINEFIYKNYIRKGQSEKEKDIRSKYIWRVYKTVAMVHKYKNPLLIAIWKIDSKIFDLMRWVNWKLIKYEKVRFVIYLILKNAITNPIIIILNKYYEIIIILKSAKREALFYKVMLGLFLCVLVFTNAILVFYLVLKILVLKIVFKGLGKHTLILLVYIIIVMMGILYDLLGKRVYLHSNRVKGTLTGVLVTGMLPPLKYLKKDKKKLYYFQGFYKGEESFYHQWEGSKADIMPHWCSMKKEIKNRPSYHVYKLAYEMLSEGAYAYNIWLGCWWYLEKKEKGEVYEKIKFLYEYEKQRLKVLLYLIWDIEDYLGYKKYNKIGVHKVYGTNLEFEEEVSMYLGFFSSKESVLRLMASVDTNKFFEIESNYKYYERLYFFVYRTPNDNLTVLDRLYYKYWNDEGVRKLLSWNKESAKCESEIREMLLKMAEGLRPGWEEEKREENLEERNERRLKELENLVKKELGC